MNLNLDYTGFEKYLIDRYEQEDANGIQYIFKFNNGRGASVVKHEFSYGYSDDEWELAVLLFKDSFDDKAAPDEYRLDYDTPITDDVLGWLDDTEVRNILEEIQKLPTMIS